MMDCCRLCGGSFIAAVGKAASPQGSVSAYVFVDLRDLQEKHACREVSLIMHAFLSVWGIKLNLIIVIMLIWKEGRHRALILQVPGDFFLFS